MVKIVASFEELGRKFNSELVLFGLSSGGEFGSSVGISVNGHPQGIESHFLEFIRMSGEPNEIQKWKCPFCGLKIEDKDSQSFRQRVIFHRKMHDEA